MGGFFGSFVELYQSGNALAGQFLLPDKSFRELEGFSKTLMLLKNSSLPNASSAMVEGDSNDCTPSPASH